ncbi:MAG: cytochrome c oxidase assembly protein [Galbitalea sp.]
MARCRVLPAGVGSFLAVNLGFLGVYSHDLRWAIQHPDLRSCCSSRPALLALGRPVTLARRTLSERGVDRLDRFKVVPRVIKFLGNAVVEPFVTVLIFAIFPHPDRGRPALQRRRAGGRHHPDSRDRPAAGCCR